jgi:hypothetical protein
MSICTSEVPYNCQQVFENFIFANIIAIKSASRIMRNRVEIPDSKHCFFLSFLNYGTRTPYIFGEAEGAVYKNSRFVTLPF